jgi:2-dehydropantoate 2-reductase
MPFNKKIVIYGAGAIGTSIAAWLAPQYPQLYLLARGEHAKVIKAKGLSFYHNTGPKTVVPIKVIEDLNEQPDAEIIIITVKNYDLESVAKEIKAKVHSEPLILGFQNGVENQKVLPQYFKKVIYGVVCYNAWRDAPGVVGYRSQGAVVIGTLNNDLEEELQEIKSILGEVMIIKISSYIKEAAYNKLVLNLNNAVLTLLGQKSRTVQNADYMRKIITAVVYEGIEVLHKLGMKEERLPNIPSWHLFMLLFKLPSFLSNPLFKLGFGGPGINSMAQDILIKKQNQTEIDSFNGFIVKLAKENELKVPLNEKIYNLCKAKFSEPVFQPMDEKELYKLLFSPASS